MGWKVVSTMRYDKRHPDPKKRGKPFSMESVATYPTRAEAERQATGSAMYDAKVLKRRGVVYSVKEVRDPNPSPRKRRGSWPRGKTPPHLKRFLFK